MFLGVGYNCAYAQDDIKKDGIVSGPFKTDLFSEGKIYFIKRDDDKAMEGCDNISFMLEYKRDNQVKKEKIDHYTEDGGCPEIESVFFEKLRNKEYVFVMVVWHQNHQGAGVYGEDYQTYAYTKNGKGILSLDRKISKDKNLSGFEGGVDCINDSNPNGDDHCEKTYKYKTAAALKAYLKKKYH